MATKKNIGLVQIMLNHSSPKTTLRYICVTQEEVDNYPHMTGYRPGVYYPTCDRTIRELTDKEAEFNSYEWDLIKYLWHTGGYEGACSTR